MNKQRKTSNILNVFQYDEATGAVTVNGNLTAGSLIKSGGTSSQFLKADGSVDSVSYTTSARTITINGTTYDLTANRTWNVGTVLGTGSTNRLAKFTASNTIGNSLVYDDGNSVGINTTSPYDYTQFSLDINGGLIIKNVGKTAQFVLINSDPSTGGNNGYVIWTAGGTTSTSFANIQTYYGTSIAAGTLRLQAAGGVVLIGSATAVTGNGLLQVAGDVNISGSFKVNGVAIGNQTITVSGDASGSGTTGITLTLANSGVTAGTYGSSTLVPVVTVDSKGRITNVTTASISGALTFIGDVTGTGTTGSSTSLTLANSGVTAGTYTKVTVDSKGRVTVGASATTSDIAEGTNLYYTDARVLAYLGANNYATQSYVGTQIANLIGAAPTTLDTLNELAAALGNDPSFATTITTSIGTKVPQARTITINGTSYDLTANRSWTINSMVYPSAGIALSTGTAWGTSITDNSSNWNTAYGWGNHASAGYLTTSSAASTYQPLDADLTAIAALGTTGFLKRTGANTWSLDTNTYLTSYTETDPYRVTAVAVSGTSTKTITLTRADSSTVTTTWTDYDTDTNTYVTSAGFSGGTLTLTRNDSGTVSVSLDGRYALSSHNQAWSTITSTPTTLSGYGISDGLYSTTSDFTTAGTGWYRVATTSGDGRGTYYVEVFTTGGNHNPAIIKIYAHGDWGSDKLISVETDGGFPASAVRITRSSTNTFLEVNFTTQILGASLRVTRLGFNSGTVLYSGSLPAGGDTVKESLTVNSRINTSSLSISGNTVLHAGNYNSYSPTLTGGGASGTWGISITGNAATVGGYAVSGSVGANTVVIRDVNNYVYFNYINSNVSETENPTINSFYTSNGDGWLRKSSLAHVRSQLGNYGGWITSYTETDTLNSVTSRGNTTNNSVRFGANVDISPTNSAFRFYDGTTFRGGFGTDAWAHSGSDANLTLYVNGDNTLFFSTSGTKRASLSSSAFNSLVPLQQNGNTVWHAGNFTPSNYLPLSGGVMTGSLVNNTDGAIMMESNGSENNNWLWKENSKAWGLFWFNRGSQSGQTIGGYTTVGAELMFMGGGSGIAMPSGWTGYYSGSYIAAMISNYNGYIYSASTVYAAGDMRAPVFYDANDTGYYGDFASTSRMNTIVYDNLKFSGDQTYGLIGRNAYVDTINGRGSDPLELNYYDGGPVIIGTTSTGSKSLYAAALYDSGNRVITTSSIGSQSVAYAGYTSVVASNSWSSSSGNEAVRVFAPNGASASWDGGITGAFRIRLPQRANNTMWTMRVRIYSYSTNQTSEYILGNYSYDQGGYNASAYFTGGVSSTVCNVRFGNQDGYDCVWIGETGSSWSYPVVSVIDFTGGFRSGNASSWKDNWNITYVTSFGTIATTIYPSIKVGGITAVNGLNAYSIEGNSNVAGTGNASYHPSGIYSTGNNWLYGSMYLNGNDINGIGTAYASGSFRAPIFYDSQDTSYYLDPNSDTYIRNLYLGAHDSGAASFYFGENSSGWYGMKWYWDSGYDFYWYGRNAGTDTLIMNYTTNDNSYLKWYRSFHLNGSSIDYVGSLYFNGAGHIQPNGGSYGALQMTNSKNGWAGIRFVDSDNNLMMNSNESGHHRNGYGWQFRWYNGSFYISTNSYGGGSEYTALHSGNYTSYVYSQSTSNSIYSRKDTTGQWIKPYYEYGNYLTSESPGTLKDQMGGGGLRVDFMHPSYAGGGSWNHVITWSGYQAYNMYQLGAYYDGGTTTNLYVRSEANHGNASWTSWRRLLNEVADPYAVNMNQYVRTSDSPSFSEVYVTANGSVRLRTNNTRNLQVYGTAGADCGIVGTNSSGNFVFQLYGYAPNSEYGFLNGTWASWDLRKVIGGALHMNNNNSYYINTTGASYVYSMESATSMTAADGFHATANWFRAYGDNGLYQQSYGGHFRRSASASYGTWELFGYNKGGYAGLNIIDPQGYWNNLMYESGNGGVYQQNGNGWHFYYHRGNSCLGLATSTTSGSYRAYVAGSLYAEGDIVAYSDVRKKKDIVTIDNALEKVLQMRGVYYTKIYNEDAVLVDVDPNKRLTGVIAQEINEVLPEVVTYAKDIDEYGVSYGNVVGVLIEAIKEQQAQIEELQNKLDNVLSSR